MYFQHCLCYQTKVAEWRPAMKLSIAVVTMNRALQLQQALLSCLNCNLPDETEFVIIDNASTDNTENVVHTVLCGTNFIYEKMETNLGCGGGRNYAFQKCNGDYMYVLDDDAYIEDRNLFHKALSILENDKAIVSLSTQIFDCMLDCNRVLIDEMVPYKNGLYKCHMFYGGSHFLRKSFFTEPPYLANKYGREELMPSLMVWDAKKVNAVDMSTSIIHNPTVNRWEYEKNLANREIVINDCAIKFAVKKMMYPLIFQPLVLMAFKMRCKKHLSMYDQWETKVKDIITKTTTETPISYKLRVRTVVELYKNYGMAAF